ncbi:MAG: DUF4446 family protein [Clostridia bacterium]|nr:DUF4446 family protein [Clostridia bacterium]MDD4375300.1 DUF4446 family protein [Clostridia bacterium]
MMKLLRAIPTEYVVLLTLLLLIMWITIIVLYIKNKILLKKYIAMYEKTLKKFNSKTNIKDEFQSIYDRLNQVENKCKNTESKINEVDIKIEKCIQKTAIKRYDAYESGNNELSFVVAMLDNKDDGVLLNNVFHRTGSNLYLKKVKKGETEGTVSNEERQVLNEAKNRKSFI